MGYAYIEIDGFYGYVFPEDNGGFWEAHTLKAIADKLDDLNKGWNDKINKYFENESKKSKKSKKISGKLAKSRN